MKQPILFNVSDENNSFSNDTPGYWRIPKYLPDGISVNLKEILELRSPNDFELHVKEVEKRGTRIEIENSGYNLAGFDHFKSQVLAELKRVKYDLEDMVYRMDLTYDEIIDVLDIKYTSATSIGYTLPPGKYEINDLNKTLEYFSPDNVKVDITIDYIRLKSTLTINNTIRFTKNSFFYTILGFTQSHSGVLGNIEGFVQLIPGSYESDKPINIPGVDELKCDCNKGSIVNGVREPILFGFRLTSPPPFIKFAKNLESNFFQR